MEFKRVMGVMAVTGAAWLLYQSWVNRAQAGTPAPEPDVTGVDMTAREKAAALVLYHNLFSFGGWFTGEPRRMADVLAVFAIESRYNFDAIGDLHLEDKSWGIGQVRGTTAGDYGITDPRELLKPSKGVLVAMKHLKWSHTFLKNRLGRAPTFEEWIGSYNAGVGNVLRGYIPREYVARWKLEAGR